MFRKRKKQIFPEGTFIPTKPRVMAILQLCLAFTAILFALSKPFMAEHFTIKSHLLVYDYVMGRADESLKKDFEDLPNNKKELITAKYEALIKVSHQSFFEKLERSLILIFFEISIYERMWIIFSILISILLLKKVEGAKQSAWILPLIAVCYLISNEFYTLPKRLTKEEKLYPEEKLLEEKFMTKRLNTYSVIDQQKELLKAWQIYLISHFLNEAPSANPEIFEIQKKKSAYAFEVARAETINVFKATHEKDKQPLFLLAAYLFWNLHFAITMQYRPKLQQNTQEVQLNSRVLSTSQNALFQDS